MDEFQLKKVLYPTPELLQIFPFSLSTLDRITVRLIKDGRCPTEMGRYKFKGCRSDCWDPMKLKEFMVKEQLKPKVKYSHDLLEQEKIKKALVISINNNNQHLIGVRK